MSVMKLLYYLIFLLFGLNSFSQDSISIRDVFDFDIGDVFHFDFSFQSMPLGADRKKILEKYYSPQHDTLYYSIEKYSYRVIIEDYPDYHFEFSTDTNLVYYTNLDSSIFYGIEEGYCGMDTLSDIILCEKEAVGYSVLYSGDCWHGTYYRMLFSKGLGIVDSLELAAGEYPNYSREFELSYYKKGTETCGRPDDMFTSIPEIKHDIGFKIYPNPVYNDLIVEFSNRNNSDSHINIFNTIGELQLISNLPDAINTLDISNLKSGIYYIQLFMDNERIIKKIIKY